MTARLALRVGCAHCHAYAWQVDSIPIARLYEYRATAQHMLVSNELWLQPCERSASGYHVVVSSEATVAERAVAS